MEKQHNEESAAPLPPPNSPDAGTAAPRNGQALPAEGREVEQLTTLMQISLGVGHPGSPTNLVTPPTSPVATPEFTPVSAPRSALADTPLATLLAARAPLSSGTLQTTAMCDVATVAEAATPADALQDMPCFQRLVEEVYALFAGDLAVVEEVANFVSARDQVTPARMEELLMRHPDLQAVFLQMIERYQTPAAKPSRRSKRGRGTPKRPRVRSCTCGRI